MLTLAGSGSRGLKVKEIMVLLRNKEIIILDQQKHQMSILDAISVIFRGIFIEGLDPE